MRVEIIRGTDLERERWNFVLYADYSGDRVFFQDYYKEYRPTKRHNWRVSLYWERVGSRTSVKTPPAIPPDVEQEARAQLIEQLIEQLMKTPITQ